MLGPPPTTTRTDTLFPYAALFRSAQAASPHYESALRGSTFLWADRIALAPTVGNIGKARRPALESFARQYLRSQAGRLALNASSVEHAILIDLQDLGHGPVIAREIGRASCRERVCQYV